MINQDHPKSEVPYDFGSMWPYVQGEIDLFANKWSANVGKLAPKGFEPCARLTAYGCGDDEHALRLIRGLRRVCEDAGAIVVVTKMPNIEWPTKNGDQPKLSYCVYLKWP